MVSLKEVEKPIAGLKKLRKVEREEELQKKFAKLSEEEHVLKAYEASKKKVRFKTSFVFLSKDFYAAPCLIFSKNNSLVPCFQKLKVNV